MQPKIRKTIRIALILSISLHVALFAVLKVLYTSESSSIKDKTYLEISEVRSQRAMHTIKRKVYNPPIHTPIKHQQKKIEVTPQVAPIQVTAPLVHRNPVTPIRNFPLPNHSILDNDTTGIDASMAMVTHGSGNQRGYSGFNSQKVLRRTTQKSFKPPVDTILTPVSDVSMPDGILTQLGQHIVANHQAKMVDIVFIVDGSGSMKDNINAIRRHLSNMTELFKAAELDFTFGIVIFRDHAGYNLIGWDFELVEQTRSIKKIKRHLASVKCVGGEKALDALVRATDEVTARKNADVHFILITDEYVSGKYTARDVLKKVTDAKIKVDVIGRNEPFNKYITRRTGGLWLPISSLSTQ